MGFSGAFHGVNGRCLFGLSAVGGVHAGVSGAGLFLGVSGRIFWSCPTIPTPRSVLHAHPYRRDTVSCVPSAR